MEKVTQYYPTMLSVDPQAVESNSFHQEKCTHTYIHTHEHASGMGNSRLEMELPVQGTHTSELNRGKRVKQAGGVS